jgi:two-component system nitrogen regulation sensor histidine kinase GlnL
VARDLQRVIDAVLDGVVVVDEDARVEFLNAEACRILEISAEAATMSRIGQVVGPDHALAKLVQTVFATGRSCIESERKVRRRYDEDLLVDIAASPLFEEDRSCSGVVLALRDRTIQRTLAEWVSEKEQLQAFGQIAAGIAHEVKNPLGGIRGAAELISARVDDSRTREAASLIVREVDRIVSLVDDLMVFTHGERLPLAPENIHRVLDDVIELLTMDPLADGVALERAFDPSIPELLANRDRLIQVFLNLGRNALQALEGEGRLRFETRMTLDHRLAGDHGEPLPTLSVSVEDDGPGIPPELMEKVMTPLFTTRSGGTGLGLAVARHWVAQHGGAMRIESVPEGGTRVRVSLPLRRPNGPEPHEAARHGGPGGSA